LCKTKRNTLNSAITPSCDGTKHKGSSVVPDQSRYVGGEYAGAEEDPHEDALRAPDDDNLY
jgi:hypothetical protein